MRMHNGNGPIFQNNNSYSAVQTQANDILCPKRSIAKNCSMIRSFILIAFFFMSQCQAAPCSCSPTIYNWTLNFNDTCSDLPLSDGLGIHSTCKIMRRNLDPPVKAVRLRFLEYGEDFGDIVQWKEMPGSWEDGDVMTIESVTRNSTDVVPTAAAIEIDAKTEDGQNIMLQWLVDYTNACGVDPYENIPSIAWIHFENVGPKTETCSPCEEEHTDGHGKGKGAKSSKSCKRTIVKVKSPKTSKSLKKKSKKGKSSHHTRKAV